MVNKTQWRRLPIGSTQRRTSFGLKPIALWVSHRLMALIECCQKGHLSLGLWCFAQKAVDREARNLTVVTHSPLIAVASHSSQRPCILKAAVAH